MSLLRITRTSLPRAIFQNQAPRAFSISTINMADAKQKLEQNTQAAGEAKATNPANPSVISSAGAVGKQFNPDGAIGQVGEAIGGPFSKDGAIGSQFDASKGGIAGQVEKAVDGPSRPATEKK